MNRLRRLDREGVRRMRALPHLDTLDRVLVSVSAVTDHAGAWIVLGVSGALADRRRRGSWAVALARVVAAELVCRTIKRAVARERPRLEGLPPLVEAATEHSMPSSHAADAVAAAWAYGPLTSIPALSGFALLQAASRLYLGVHYPSDVVTGALVGAACGAGFRRP